MSSYQPSGKNRKFVRLGSGEPLEAHINRLAQMSYPVSQLFNSVQGEGVNTGVWMSFVRLAGCNVGVYATPDYLKDANESALAQLRVLSPKHSVCTDVFGEKFLCDTNYHSIGKATVKDLVAEAMGGKCEWLSITGGEPFIHDLEPLVEYAIYKGMRVHIETSGTQSIPQKISDLAWICCSPKVGYLAENRDRIDEYKFVLSAASASNDKFIHNPHLDANMASDPGLGLTCLVQHMREIAHERYASVQPVNDIDTIRGDNMKFVLKLIEAYPEFRLSCQLHKILGME